MSRSAHKKLEHWTKRYAPIPKDKLPEMIGEAIHLSWASSPGFVWILDRVDGDRIFLHTPTTGKRLESHANYAMYSRHWQQTLGLDKAV